MDGILVIDKPQWLTSHDIVLKLRHKLGQDGIGHAGTLDPIATGILVLVLGRATKLVSRLINQDKIYEVSMLLGTKTDTGDTTGKILKKEEIRGTDIDEQKIKNTLNKYIGPQEQVPPMVSAKKHKGRPLYKYARQGKIVEREPKKIEIYSIELGVISLPEVAFTVHCSKGTYIRTLCEDIGEALGVGACASKIRRVKSGAFIIKQATPLEAVLSYGTEEIKQLVIPLNLANPYLTNV